MADSSEHLNSDEDVEAILRLAIRQNSATSENLQDRLKLSAQELGISDAQLAAAEEAYRKEKLSQQAEQTRVATEAELWSKWRKIQIHSFYRHAMSFVSVNLGLMALNWFTTGSLSWVWFVIVSWAIGLTTHLGKVLASYSDENHAEFQKWVKKQNRMSSGAQSKRKRMSDDELEDRVESYLKEGKWDKALDFVIDETGWEYKRAKKFVKEVADD